ncbi:long-chain fatty acid--CoA ligase [Nonomuraea turkmeniaca]|uniref:Long-chain fatty acid--CoA ligase n=1 Tax=Nonomuraea turkmeniaca TaxID=103838 RepID=A0A5S4FF95_9ACTN|nr:AMP-binding protein [Nonomuraea turkmeniaca]TMR17664.1 long-chain fatty acid--CoA ligase [Nonomuraea turkmeniaca]
MIVPGLLARRAAEEPERVALEVAGGGTLTFAEWHARADSLARGLARRGVRRGDRLGLLFGAENWTDFAVAYCATQLAGAVAVPISDRLAPAEVAYMLEHCSAIGLLHAGKGTDVPSDGGYWSAVPAELDPGSREPEPPGPGDLAQILYTSGTTGRPKAVAATHANLTYGSATRANRRKFGHSQLLLHAFPIGTNAGQAMLINALDARPAVLTLARFTPGRFARLIESRRVGTVFLVPAMALELLNAGLHERYDFSGVVLLGSAASALPAALCARLAAAFPKATVTNYYTSTEAAPAQTVMIYDPSRPAALGRPALGSGLRITGPGGGPLAAGETGEIWLRSPAATRSYYRDEQASGHTFRDGWVRMGDLGYLDADGYLYLVDRESDVVKSGAYKVSTVQVEAALHEHPDVAEAAVTGVPHPVMGTVLAAVVVPRSRAPRVTELRAFLMTRLAQHELPARVTFVDRLPRNHSGKVVKSDLRDLLKQADLVVEEGPDEAGPMKETGTVEKEGGR